MPLKIYLFQTESTGQNFEIYWSDIRSVTCMKLSVTVWLTYILYSKYSYIFQLYIELTNW